MIVETFSPEEWQRIFNTLRRFQNRPENPLVIFDDEERVAFQHLRKDGWTDSAIDEWLLRRFLRKLAVLNEMGLAYDYHLKRGREHQMLPCPELVHSDEAGTMEAKELWSYLATVENNLVHFDSGVIFAELLERLERIQRYVVQEAAVFGAPLSAPP